MNKLQNLTNRKKAQRRQIRKETSKSVKHWCVTEKGHTNTRRIHLHGLFYAREGQTKWQLTKLLYENWIDGYKYYGKKFLLFKLPCFSTFPPKSMIQGRARLS